MTKTERIERLQTEIQQLENLLKRITQERKTEERRIRTRRLCQRMGQFESMLPDVAVLSDEQFKIFLERTVATDRGRRLLNELIALTNAKSSAVCNDNVGG
jgi:hypothetical protein